MELFVTHLHSIVSIPIVLLVTQGSKSLPFSPMRPIELKVKLETKT